MNADLRIGKWEAPDLDLELDNQNERTLTHGGLHVWSIYLILHCEHNLWSLVRWGPQASEDSWPQSASRKVLVLEELDS